VIRPLMSRLPTALQTAALMPLVPLYLVRQTYSGNAESPVSSGTDCGRRYTRPGIDSRRGMHIGIQTTRSVDGSAKPDTASSSA
jgi:hypothetical protein